MTYTYTYTYYYAHHPAHSSIASHYLQRIGGDETISLLTIGWPCIDDRLLRTALAAAAGAVVGLPWARV